MKKYKIIHNKVDTKKLLFERMKIIGGMSINESRKTEELASNILLKNNISDNIETIINQFKTIDTTQNQILLPAMATAYAETNKNIDQVKDVFGSASELINSNKIKPVQATKNGYLSGNDIYPDFLKFSEYIHSLASQTKQASMLDKGADQQQKAELVDTSGGFKAMWENDNIAIYDGNDIGNCIAYGKGGLTGKQYSFCIGNYGSSNMWQSYRDNNGASFYYVIDKKRTTDDPFHIVVVMPLESGDVMLTHEPNATANMDQFDSKYSKSEFGMGYFDHLKKQGVPVDTAFPSVKKSPEEISKTNLLSQKNDDLDWFKNLGNAAKEQGLFPEMDNSQATFKMMSDYIGRGHLLSDEQFKYLFDLRNGKGGFSLLKKYLDTGQAITEPQLNMLMGDG